MTTETLSSSRSVLDPLDRTDSNTISERFSAVRKFTESLCERLEPEDYVIQTVTEISPTKWHLAHVSWFFETFILKPHASGYKPLDAQYAYLFNSYYVQAGERHRRDQRGYLSRPTVKDVYAYRAYVDEHMVGFLESVNDSKLQEVAPILEIGLQHEQQHQELLLTDIKHVFSANPIYPIYHPRSDQPKTTVPELEWVPFEEGLYEIGHESDDFFYDNEGPRHRHFLDAYELANRHVTNGEYLEFMKAGGYEKPELWLSDGWAARQAQAWTAPFYWTNRDGRWHVFTLAGLLQLNLDEPVCHISYFEADAYARWAGARLPTEQEWEIAARTVPIQGNFVENGNFHPVPAGLPEIETGALLQMYGNVWEWTRSQYAPYPGYAPEPGALGEYNGKFMCNQFVLRGGSCATSITHIRPTYRNFFYPDACWQFTGIRLAKDA